MRDEEKKKRVISEKEKARNNKKRKTKRKGEEIKCGGEDNKRKAQTEKLAVLGVYVFA